MRLKPLVTAIAVVLVLTAALELRKLAGLAGIDLPRFAMPYGRSSVDNLLAVLLVAAAAFLIARRGSLFANLGLQWTGWRGPAVTLLATAPFWIGLACLGGLSHDFTARDLLFTALLFPLAEEIIFRGFGFVFVRKTLGWPMAAALLVQAAIFGLIHWLGAGAGTGVALQVLAITFAGGIVFAVLDALGGYSIWNGLVLHVSLNAAWTVFAVSQNAATGWTGNVLRIAGAVLAIALVYLVRRRKPQVA